MAASGCGMPGNDPSLTGGHFILTPTDGPLSAADRIWSHHEAYRGVTSFFGTSVMLAYAERQL